MEQSNTAYNNPFKYNGKELDEVTGLYYYGARYYDPKTSIWLSVDPLAVYNPVMETEFYGDGQHNGGVYNSGNLNPYIYTYQNPIVYVDPNGKQTFFLNTRSFAPPIFGSAYGIMDKWKGDRTNYSTDPNASYRIGGKAKINMDSRTITSMSMMAATTTNLTTGESKSSPSKFIARKNWFSLDNFFDSSNSMSIYTHNYGNNALAKGSFDIDTKSNLTITTKEGTNGNKIVGISGTVYGDKFPSNETYVSDSYGNAVMIGVSGPNIDPEIGPYLLGGSKNTPMQSIDAKIIFDKKNKIIGASSNGKSLKIDNYGKAK
ncbi:RHS repeat-associated core domain-containing protein [Kaistella soli]|uniref:RHS repeat-associated core domain-containing protein n=1 Tax=Kaistella soli TaxID=2849654 RepID=UPI001FE4398D|nr:RHS repeat-associated core domain-containing protein [Kaistella soli]